MPSSADCKYCEAERVCSYEGRGKMGCKRPARHHHDRQTHHTRERS